MRSKLCWLGLVSLVLGCKNSVVEPLSSSSTSGVSATLAAPAYVGGFPALANGGTATLRLGFSGATSTTLSDAVGSSTTPPTGVTAAVSGTVSCTTLALLATDVSGAILLVNGCTGDGTITIGVGAGVALDADQQPNAATATRTVVVENTRPAATTSLAQSVVGTTDAVNTLTITFTNLVTALSATNANGELSISGCGAAPTPAITTTTVAGHSVATVALSGGACANGATVSIVVNLDHVTNLAGTAGLASANPAAATYTISTTAPLSTLANATYPGSQVAVRSGQTAAVAMSYSGAASQTLAIGTGSSVSPPAGLTIGQTGTAACSSVSIASPSVAGATINVGGCTGEGTITARVAAGVATSSGGVTNAASNIKTILVYTVPPTVTASTAPANATGVDGAATLTYTFSKLMTALDSINAAGQFTIGGCSGTNPGASVVMSNDGAGHSIATLSLSGGACVSGESVSVDLNMGLVSDGAGNLGDASYHPTTLSYVIP